MTICINYQDNTNTEVAASWQPIYRDGVKFAGAYLVGSTLNYRLFP